MVTSAKDPGAVLPEPNPEADGGRPFAVGDGQPFASVEGKPGWVLWLKHELGLDRAVGYTVLARGVQILSSTGTVLLILRFLTLVEQGYYYTLLSLASLQVVFELGFSFVVLQMAAHESVHLKLHADGRIEGDPVAQARLASALQLTVRWYLRAAIVMAIILVPLGILFFSRKSPPGVSVSWLGPWVTGVLAVSVSFLVMPLFAFFEGCKEIWQVAKFRMYQALMTMAMSWGTMASGHGLYACTMVNLGVILVGAIFLRKRWALLAALLRYPVHGKEVCWREEIWPFQWKTGVSWLCSYFMVQVFTPVLFAYQGPADAGKLGLSLSIVGYLPIVVLSWMSTKATPFGQFVKLGRYRELDHVFFRTLRQSLVVILLLAAGCFGGVVVVQRVFPALAARMEGPSIFVFLLLAAVGTFVVQGMAVYLRSFKQEPYLFQSTAVAGLSFLGVLIVAPRRGSSGVALVYFLCSGILSVLWAVQIFQKQRNGWAGKPSRDLA
jgi:hypothetical protein